MDVTFLLFLNILVLSTLILLCIWLTGYNLRWWLRTQRAANIKKNFYDKLVFLEIKLPREIHKSPGAMEIVFNALYQVSGHKPDPVMKKYKKDNAWYKNSNSLRSEFYAKFIQGGMRLWSSLEIVSDEGQLRYFLVTPAKFAEIFKAYTFSQYPGIEITETEDYTLKHNYTSQKDGDTQIFLGRFKLKDKDYLPIKTYIDYGLDKDPKEEYKIDPMTPLLESMAAAGPGENFWYQLLIRPTIDEDNWRNETRKRMDEILGIKRKEKDGKYDPKGKIESQDRQVSNLMPHEKTELEVLQRNIEKNAYDTIIRLYYVAKKDKFNPNKGVQTALNGMKSFGRPGYNSFEFIPYTTDADTPFLDPKGIKTESTRKYWWYLYKMRTGYYIEAEGGELAWKKFFHKWLVAKNFEWAMGHIDEMKEYLSPGHIRENSDIFAGVLNTEELATIWHFPGKTFGNTSARVDSIKSDPPRNLPI